MLLLWDKLLLRGKLLLRDILLLRDMVQFDRLGSDDCVSLLGVDSCAVRCEARDALGSEALAEVHDCESKVSYGALGGRVKVETGTY